MLGKKGDVNRSNSACPTCEKTVIKIGRGRPGLRLGELGKKIGELVLTPEKSGWGKHLSELIPTCWITGNPGTVLCRRHWTAQFEKFQQFVVSLSAEKKRADAYRIRASRGALNEKPGVQ